MSWECRCRSVAATKTTIASPKPTPGQVARIASKITPFFNCRAQSGVGLLAYTSLAERIAQRASPAPVGQEAYSTKRLQRIYPTRFSQPAWDPPTPPVLPGYTL